MAMFNVDFIGGLSSRVSSATDRFFSAIQGFIDQVKCRVKEMWEANKVVVIVGGVVAAVALVLTAPIWIPVMPALMRAIGGALKGVIRLFSALINAVLGIFTKGVRRVGNAA